MTLLVLLLSLTQAAIPPLGEADLVQLRQGTSDGPAPVNAPGLFPLLRNAQMWKPGDEAGAAIPDYQALLDKPEGHRGELYLVEGVFGGVPRGESLLVGPLAQPGPWDGKLERWGVVTDKAAERVALVYLVNPPVTPAPGAAVRVPARFYKVWIGKNRTGQAYAYPVFVGHSAQVIASGPGAMTPVSSLGLSPMRVLAGLVLVLLVAFIVLRKRLGMMASQPRPLSSRRARDAQGRAPAASAAGDLDDEEDPGPPLPKDPADALRELERRRSQKAE